MNIYKICVNGTEYQIKDRDAQKVIAALKSQLEEVKEELKSVPRLQIIEVD